jgi:hypothetical protein
MAMTAQLAGGTGQAAHGGKRLQSQEVRNAKMNSELEPHSEGKRQKNLPTQWAN